jgi:nuclear protein localization family protein 4
MIIRLRSRDGLERIEVDDGATVAGLKLAIHQRLHIPMEQLQLSRDAGLLTSKAPEQLRDMAADSAGLRALGLQHGDMVGGAGAGAAAARPGLVAQPLTGGAGRRPA